ncbi:adhesion G protein-coupled receptor L4-like [Dendronephthya gigantea]|uniref:adhesion G protein-coupled receptor L4-like n=1 Tax=Dendronephthya gigantea TaxID=151771 RepID=UPI00106BF1F6|nr:adhesion G protein-coupled receptor L4-like [Dendronephthya gigantea]
MISLNTPNVTGKTCGLHVNDFLETTKFDDDECKLKNYTCHSEATCSSTNGSFVCTCIKGFTGNGTVCKDVDECALKTHTCHRQATCNNTIGSYICTCDQGWTGDGRSCKDDDECASRTQRCHLHAICQNTIGSYTCICKDGFSGNGTVCKGSHPICFSARDTLHSKFSVGMLDRLDEEAYELYRKDKSTEDRKNVAQEIIKDLTCVTNLDAVTGKTSQMNEQNLTEAVRILQKIVNLNISDLDVLGPVNNILDPRNADAWRTMKDGKLIGDLVMTLQNYATQQGEALKNDASNSAIFYNRSNIQLRVEYTNQSQLTPERGIFNFPNASFVLSPDALAKDSGAVVAVVWYKTLNSFLTDGLDDKDDINGIINSTIISASVQPHPMKNLEEPVRISWDTKESTKKNRKCAHWNPELSESGWKTAACEEVFDESNNHRITCECQELAAFAFVEIFRNLESHREVRRSNVHPMSIVGCTVSLVCVLLTILAHVFLWRRLDERAKIPSKVLMNLCVAIVIANIFCIIAESALHHEKFCIAASILLYFALLVLFGWMLGEGFIILFRLAKVYLVSDYWGKFLKAFYGIYWGIPVIIDINVATGVDDWVIHNEYVCWCRSGSEAFWIFIASLCAILLINVVIFLFAFRHASSSQELCITQTKEDTAHEHEREILGLRCAALVHLPLLGLTWLFGLLAFHQNQNALKYLFVIFNILQALMLVVSHVVLNRMLHKAMHKEKQDRLFKPTKGVPSTTREDDDEKAPIAVTSV